MYKWHVNSAIGRGRPLANDLARVADGIAASLRHFSISTSKAAQNEDKPPVSRAQRSANAAKEVSSLPRAAPSRGIDARSLAAKPQQGFTIRRLDFGTSQAPQRGAGPRSRGGASGRGVQTRGGRGAQAARGGRGGPRGRGGQTQSRGRGARGGRAKRRSNTKKQVPEEDEEYVEPPLEKEEEAWFDGFESGFETPYNPTTNLDYLKRSGASVMPPSSSMGAVESVAHRFQVASGMVSGHDTHSAIHLERIKHGDAVTFETPEAKAVAQAYFDQIRQADENRLADKEGRERKVVEPLPLPTLDTVSEDVRSELAKAWVAGQYAGPKHADKGDILGLLDKYTKLNETYLPHSKKGFEEKLKSLLPAAYQKQETRGAATPTKAQKPL